MKNISLEFRSQIEPVRQELEAWRRTRKHRDPIPVPIWQAMTRLSRVHGISPVSQALGINYYDLKRRANSLPEVSLAKGEKPPAFVELNVSPSAGIGCVVEVEVEDREARMTLRLPVGSGTDPIGLLQAFWRREV
jgi:hypothetical protein